MMVGRAEQKLAEASAEVERLQTAADDLSARCDDLSADVERITTALADALVDAELGDAPPDEVDRLRDALANASAAYDLAVRAHGRALQRTAAAESAEDTARNELATATRALANKLENAERERMLTAWRAFVIERRRYLELRAVTDGGMPDPFAAFDDLREIGAEHGIDPTTLYRPEGTRLAPMSLDDLKRLET